MNLALLFERSEFRALQIWFYNGQRKIGIERQSSFVTFLAHERKVSIKQGVCSFLWWQRNEPKKATADKILALKKLSFHTMLKTRYAQTVKQKTYLMIMFFNHLTITAKFYNAEEII